MSHRPTPRRPLYEHRPPEKRPGRRQAVAELAEIGAMGIALVLGVLVGIVGMLAFVFVVPDLVIRTVRNLVGDRLLAGAMGALLMVPAVMLGYRTMSRHQTATLTPRRWIVAGMTVAAIAVLGAIMLMWALTSPATEPRF